MADISDFTLATGSGLAILAFYEPREFERISGMLKEEGRILPLLGLLFWVVFALTEKQLPWFPIVSTWGRDLFFAGLFVLVWLRLLTWLINGRPRDRKGDCQCKRDDNDRGDPAGDPTQ